MLRPIERLGPISLGIAATIAALFLSIPANGYKDLLQAVINISAISVGFLATAKSILYSIGQRKIMKDMKKAGITKHLIGYFLEAIIAWFVLACLSGYMLLEDFNNLSTAYHYLFALWCGTLTWAITNFLRVIVLFNRLLRMDD